MRGFWHSPKPWLDDPAHAQLASGALRVQSFGHEFDSGEFGSPAGFEAPRTKPRVIPVGMAHKNRKVRLFVAGPDVRVITEDGELIRALTPRPQPQLPAARRALAYAQCLATGVHDVLRHDRNSPGGIRTDTCETARHTRALYALSPLLIPSSQARRSNPAGPVVAGEIHPR